MIHSCWYSLHSDNTAFGYISFAFYDNVHRRKFCVTILCKFTFVPVSLTITSFLMAICHVNLGNVICNVIWVCIAHNRGTSNALYALVRCKQKHLQLFSKTVSADGAGSLRYSGNEFQADGPATETARLGSPVPLRLLTPLVPEQKLWDK